MFEFFMGVFATLALEMVAVILLAYYGGKNK